MSPSFSIVVLTKDEEANLPDCLRSLAGIDDVHVLDSGSNDRTVEIAQEMGAKVHFNPFQSFGQQRNWAIDNIPTVNRWVMHLDADERMTPELLVEICTELSADPDYGGYHVPNKLMFCDRWLKYSGGYPTYQVRLFHVDRLRFMDYGHGQREVTDQKLGKLKQPYLHFGFSKGLDDWFSKHAVYARQEAEQAMQELQGASSGDSLWSMDSVERRRALKRLSYRLPFRGPFRFLYMLIVKRACFDGWAGLTYARMLAVYESMMAVHLKILRNRSR